MDRSDFFDHTKPMEGVAIGSFTEGIGGAGAVVLAILGLIGVLPAPLAAIAAIAIGLSLAIGGGSVASQYSRLLVKTEPRPVAQVVAAGMSMEALCGLAGVVLGILALLHVNELILLPSSLLVFGGALLMASIATARINDVRIRLAPVEETHELAQDAVYAASGSEVLIGAAAVVLGILALSGFDPLTMTLVGLLSVGASVLLSGMSMAGRMISVMPIHREAH